MGGITMRAGVEAWVMAMTPMHQKLVSITGAKEPSGIPVSQVAISKVATASKSSPARKFEKKNKNKRNRRKRFTAER
jgi:hypothetical protein